MNDILRLEYIPLSLLVEKFLEGNPKIHNLTEVKESIGVYGFRDPIAWDKTADAIVEGNGRLEILQAWYQQSPGSPPRGVTVGNDGDWLVPTLLGVDAETISKAKAYALDHNNLSLAGFSSFDYSRLYEVEGYKDYLEELGAEGSFPISMPEEDLELVLEGLEGLGETFEGRKGAKTRAKRVGSDKGDGDDKEREESLDDTRYITCPNCAYRIKTSEEV